MRGSAKSIFRGDAVRVSGGTASVWDEDTGSLAVVTLDTGDCVQYQTDNTLDTGECALDNSDNTLDTGDSDNPLDALNTGDFVVYRSDKMPLRNGRLLDYRHPHLLLAGYDGAGAGRLEVWRVDHASRTVVQSSSSVRDIAVIEEAALLSPGLAAVVEFDLDSASGCYKLTLSEFRVSVYSVSGPDPSPGPVFSSGSYYECRNLRHCHGLLLLETLHQG